MEGGLGGQQPATPHLVHLQGGGGGRRRGEGGGGRRRREGTGGTEGNTCLLVASSIE